MPTQIYRLTAAPTNLIGALDIDGMALDLQTGQTYTGRYTAVDVQGVMKFKAVVSGTTVAPEDRATPLRSYEDAVIKPVAGEDIVVWSESNGFLAINGPLT